MAVRPRRVDAVAGGGEAVVGHDVGGGHPELATAPVALHHHALEQERAAEEVRGLVDLARRHEPAYVARADDLAVDLDERHDVRLELRPRLQELRVARLLLAEAEV